VISLCEITRCKLSKCGFLDGLVADNLGTIANGAHDSLILPMWRTIITRRGGSRQSEAWVIREDTVRYLIQGGCSHVPEANSPGHASHTQHAIWSVSFWGRLLPFSLKKLSSSKFLGSAHFAQVKRRTRPLNHFLKIYTCTCEPRCARGWSMAGTNCARC